MAKSSTIFICSNCGYQSAKWLGQCPQCNEWSTFEESSVSKEEKKILKFNDADAKITQLQDTITKKEGRIATNLHEFNRALGGGFVNDEVVLLAGEPGIGKSTLLLQVFAELSSTYKSLYVSGEESAHQVALRGGRLLGASFKKTGIPFLASANLQAILHAIHNENISFLIIDSIQTLYDEDVNGLPGSVTQIKHCASKLISAAKKKGVIVVLVGHITKEGSIGGPKVLEHLVDAVLQFEGKRDVQYRVLRALKNRFGSTGEVGVFEMTAEGLKDMDVLKSEFVDMSLKEEIGLAKSIVVEGQRPLLVDIQVLVNKTVFAYPKRVAEGITLSRLQLLTALLENQKLATLSDKDVYVRVAGGYEIKGNTTTDLAIMAAVLSAVKAKPLSSKVCFCGEVSLNGRVSTPKSFESHFSELHRVSKGMQFVSSLGGAKKYLQSISVVKGLVSILR